MEVYNDINRMIEAVKAFHQKHGFDVSTGNLETMLYRTNLLTEELGEIAACLTKGKSKEQLAVEHADLFILLLGNCIVMDIDLTVAFWEKINKIMERKARRVGKNKRVSNWNKT